MRDPAIESKANELKSLVDQVNQIMSDLQDMNVEVRISYISRDEPGHRIDTDSDRQRIKLWKVEERNGYV
jgi:hypothetical protein